MSKIKNFINDTIYGNRLTTFLRITMGLLFIYSGYYKALDINNFGNIIVKYNIVPEILTPYCAVINTYLELAIGILLIIGYKIRSASFISILLMIFWTVIIAINVYRGNIFDCGCFELNKYGINEEISISLIFRDLIFLSILILIFYTRRHILSVDNAIEKKYLNYL